MSAGLNAGTLLHRRHDINRPIGQGDFGPVYQARDRRAARPPRHVALKRSGNQVNST